MVVVGRLFKEYAIADLSRYKEGAVGLRWRTETEVVSGKGQFSCGAKRCANHNDLESYEVDFKYREAGEKKQALVKLRVCPDCAGRLNHRHARRKAKRQAKEEKREAKRRRRSEDAPGGGAADAARAAGASSDPLGAGAESVGGAQAAAGAEDGARKASGPSQAAAAPKPAAPEGGGARGEPQGQQPRSADRPGSPANSSSDGGGGSAAAAAAAWTAPIEAEKSRAEEFDDYFLDMMQ
eukprot:COSAG04_NODE_1877_length_5323_cov_2.581627_4_plen_238_part_00